jgi:hypothetical protein
MGGFAWQAYASRQIEGYALMHGLALDDVVVEDGVFRSRR